MFCSNVWHALYVEKSDVKFTYYIHVLYFKIKAKNLNSSILDKSMTILIVSPDVKTDSHLRCLHEY